MQQIVQSPGAVSILYEGWQRMIPITAAPHIPSHIGQWHGDSRGHCDGNTLVVDVTNFTPKTDYQGSRENLHLVERFTRTGPDDLEYVVTMDDSTTWEKPWTLKVEGGAPTVLFRRDFSKTSLQAGTQIVVDGYRAKDGTNKMNARGIAFADGRRLCAGSEGTGAPRQPSDGRR